MSSENNDAKYIDVLFTCLKCKYFTKNLKDIETHKLTCVHNPETFGDIQPNLTQEDKIRNLEVSLTLEYLKNSILSSIIEQKIGIKIPSLFYEDMHEFHIVNTKDGKIPVILHDFIDENERKEEHLVDIKVKKKKESVERKESVEKLDHSDETGKKDVYRTVKQCIDLSVERGISQIVEVIDETDKCVENKRVIYFKKNESYAKTSNIDELFNSLNDTKTYTTIFKNIMKKRSEMMINLDIDSYINVVKQHIIKLTEIMGSKKYNVKKINSLISKSITPLESRLIGYESYEMFEMDADEIQKMRIYLEISIPHPKEYVPIDRNNMYKNFFNYSMALFTVKDCAELLLFNRYGFNNLIYLPLPKSDVADPYSFYHLERIEDGKRCWKMDCRLEEFTLSFSSNIKNYCVILFRKIYYNIYRDNEYRSDYVSKSNVTEYECGQLLQNIVILSSILRLNKVLKNIVIEKSTLKPTEKDRVNLRGDDKLQQKRFLADFQDDKNEIISSIRQLFDSISDIDIDTFYNSIDSI